MPQYLKAKQLFLHFLHYQKIRPKFLTKNLKFTEEKIILPRKFVSF